MSQLKAQLGERNLSMKGNKDILLARLKSHIEKLEAIRENSNSEKTFNMNSDPQVELSKTRRRKSNQYTKFAQRFDQPMLFRK